MVLFSLNSVKEYLDNIIGAVVILLLGLGLGVLVKKMLLRLLKEIELNRIMARVDVTYNLERGIATFSSYLIYLVTFVLFLDLLKIKSVVLYLVVGAILMVVVLTCIVGLKDIVPNLIGWFYLQRKSPIIKEGKYLEIKEISGIVERIGYLETEISTEKGDVLYVPNALFLKSKFQLRK